MIRSTLARLVVAAAAGAATAVAAAAVAAPDGLVNPGKLTVCISNGTFMPMYQSKDGKLEGFAPDMYRAVAKYWGVPVEFQPMAFAGQIPSLQAGRCDLLAELSITEARLKTLDGVTFMKGGLGLLVAEGNPKKIQARDDLAGMTVTALQSSSAQSTLESMNQGFKASGKPEMKIQVYPGAPESYAAVANQKADAVLDEVVAVNMISQRMNGKIIPLPKVFAEVPAAPYGLYVKKGSKIVEPLAKAMQAVFDDGSLQKIAVDNKIDPQLVVRPEIRTQ